MNLESDLVYKIERKFGRPSNLLYRVSKILTAKM